MFFLHWRISKVIKSWCQDIKIIWNTVGQFKGLTTEGHRTVLYLLTCIILLCVRITIQASVSLAWTTYKNTSFVLSYENTKIFFVSFRYKFVDLNIMCLGFPDSGELHTERSNHKGSWKNLKSKYLWIVIIMFISASNFVTLHYRFFKKPEN